MWWSYQVVPHMATDLPDAKPCKHKRPTLFFLLNLSVAQFPSQSRKLSDFKNPTYHSSVYSCCDARTLKKDMPLALRTLYVPGRWSFPHSSLWGFWLSTAGCWDYILASWSAESGQTARTQTSFSTGCVHKRVSVHKHRLRFCPYRWKVEGHLMVRFHVVLTPFTSVR